MDRKQFDVLVGTMRFQIIDLWKRQAGKNDGFERRIAALEARLAEQEYRTDTLTLNVAGGVNEAKTGE